MQEDHVSMGWSAARKLRKAVDNLSRIIAIELVTASRAIELRAPLTPSPVSAKIIAELRKKVAGPGPDRYLSPELVSATEFVMSGKVMSAIQ
jgi:histidine ammonia-lyase